MTIATNLRRLFNRHRLMRDNGRHLPADSALKRAREEAARGGTAYTPSPWITAPGIPAGGTAGDAIRWIEKPAHAGLRFVGYCDKLAKGIEHTGWFTDPDGHGKMRGVVYQLPGRDGIARYVAGYDNEDNGAADCGGPARVDLGTIYESDFAHERDTARRQIGGSWWTPAMDRAGYWAEAAHETARKEAARAANSLAEREAESEREYQTAWQAGSMWETYREDVAAARREALAFLAERRELRKAIASGEASNRAWPIMCGAAREKVESILATIEKAREKMRRLADGEHGELCFWAGDSNLRAAFNEGAGQAVI